GGSYRWTEIYPPSRFLLSLPLVNQFGYMDRVRDTAHHLDYISRFASFHGWLSPADYDVPLLKKTFPPFGTDALTMNGLQRLPYRAFVQWVQERLWKYRLVEWENVANLSVLRGYTMFGMEYIPNTTRGAHLIGKEMYHGWLKPPMYWDRIGKLKYVLSKDEATWLMGSIGVAYTIYDEATWLLTSISHR